MGRSPIQSVCRTSTSIEWKWRTQRTLLSGDKIHKSACGSSGLRRLSCPIAVSRAGPEALGPRLGSPSHGADLSYPGGQRGARRTNPAWLQPRTRVPTWPVLTLCRRPAGRRAEYGGLFCRRLQCGAEKARSTPACGLWCEWGLCGLGDDSFMERQTTRKG